MATMLSEHLGVYLGRSSTVMGALQNILQSVYYVECDSSREPQVTSRTRRTTGLSSMDAGAGRAVGLLWF